MPRWAVQSLEERFWAKVQIGGPDECWEWCASRTTYGYGQLSVVVSGRRRPVGAHRLAYELAVGPIPPGLDVLHTCRTRLCMNPKHLFLGKAVRPHRPRPVEERFWSKVDRSSGPAACWPWIGSHQPDGTGRFWKTGRQQDGSSPVHRVAFELEIGAIPEGLHVLHTCEGERACCNPAHFVLGTRQQRQAEEARPLEERFWEKVDRSGDCWVWTAGRSRSGYGKFSTGGSGKQRHLRAHRVAWELTNGPIPEGLFVCHRCDNPPCVRPEHLFLGTDTDNIRDAKLKGRLATGERHGRRTHPERFQRAS